MHSLKNSGTNLVIDAIHSGEDVPLKVSLLIIISTLITHLFGGSAGREGAALQIGGAFGNYIGKLFHLEERDCKIIIMCGMSACFSALFGTPIAAAVFSMEVISVGIVQYAALVPCVFAALIGNGIAGNVFGITGESFFLADIPALSPGIVLKLIILSTLFALVSAFFCVALNKCTKFMSRFLPNQYLRIAVSGILIVCINVLLHTTDYMGAGTEFIAASFVTQAVWYAFLMKILLTTITLTGGFKGGEIVPCLFIGAALGSFLAPYLGLPIAVCAACGMAGIFCGVTNCPLTSLLLSIELFGVGSLHYCAIVIAICYMLSGYYSLYHSQKIVYSKYEPRFINRSAR